MIKVCIAGVTGWTGAAVAKACCKANSFNWSQQSLANSWQDVGQVLGLEKNVA